MTEGPVRTAECVREYVCERDGGKRAALSEWCGARLLLTEPSEAVGIRVDAMLATPPCVEVSTAQRQQDSTGGSHARSTFLTH